MGFESFYGGRMGASFVIVKRFDGIDIPQVIGQENYKVKYLATTNDGQFFIYNDNHFIIKNEDNYKEYVWKLQALDGSTVDTKPDREGTGITSQQVLDSVLAEGMIQCFTKGGESTDIVNYGEYVIIDTPDKNNPENGKVYRRGMQFDSPTGGAEYIGQIVGPQGETPELDFDHYEDIIAEGGAYHLGIYDEANQDLVPGYYKDGNIEYFNDEIRYVYTTIKDNYGNIHGCVIGFKLPTLVQDFEAQSMSPYEQREVDPETGKYYNYDLISEDPTQYINNRWQHPFYQKWQIKIPNGYHGVSSTNIEIVHTKTMPEGFKDEYEGTPVYDDVNCTIPHMIEEIPLILTTPVDILKEDEDVIYHAGDTPIYDADDSVISCKINYNDQTLYVKKEDCYMDVIRYRETDYDNLESGEITYHYIGNFNTIQRITIAEDGTLTVYYSASDQPQDIEKALTWINEVSLSQEGDFIVLFNNDKIQDGRYYTTLNWIDYITTDLDGTINFFYNSNHNNPAYVFSKLIKNIKNIGIQTENPDGAGEGTGDQKIHIEFNTGTLEVIGNPLNYIIETTICRPSTAYPNAPYSHLLVYYADPALRQTLQAKWVTYPSEKYPGTVWTEWIDLGDVKGDVGGLRILEDVDSLTDLQDSGGNWIPPEQLTDDSGIIINPEGAGWAVTYTPSGTDSPIIYCYDYNSKVWYPIGSIDPGAVTPEAIIVKSAPATGSDMPADIDVAILKERGFWLASETVYFAK